MAIGFYASRDTLSNNIFALTLALLLNFARAVNAEIVLKDLPDLEASDVVKFGTLGALLRIGLPSSARVPS